MHRQRGLSLVEALIALVILSIGLISMGALQLKAMQSVSDGYQRTLASLAALDAQERLWADYKTRPDCAGLALSQVRSAWQRHWFGDGDTAVLGKGKATGDIQRQGCNLSVTVSEHTHGTWETTVYRFQLPSGSWRAL